MGHVLGHTAHDSDAIRERARRLRAKVEGLHPSAPNAEGENALLQIAVPTPERDPAILRKDQAISPSGHTLREESRQLRRLRLARRIRVRGVLNVRTTDPPPRTIPTSNLDLRLFDLAPNSDPLGMSDELLDREVFETLPEAQTEIDSWREDYNCCRPHSALGGRTPSEFAACSAGPRPGHRRPLGDLHLSFSKLGDDLLGTESLPRDDLASSW